MYLNINDSRLVENPTWEAVLEAVHQLGQEEYLILDRGGEFYVQTFRNDDDTWDLEYRQGSAEQHFAADAESTSIDHVSRAFEAFYNDSDLSTLLNWELLDLDEVEPEEGEIEYDGMIMDADWPEAIEAAQELKSFSIAGVDYNRIPFGQEQNQPTEEMDNCGGCGVRNGQLHVPGCDIEQCPNCHEQLTSCACECDEVEEGS
jgi:hypothetical protein